MKLEQKFDRQFSEIVRMIREARYHAIKSVNAELVKLYWSIGEYISKKLLSAEWGDAVVDRLAAFIQTNHPEFKGFTRRGLYRMRQFYEAYCQTEIVSPLLTQKHPKVPEVFKDIYVLDFLNLPEAHSESDLSWSIVANLKDFILEFGRDFTFVGQEYRIQVGGNDYFIDLLFFHRGLKCLVMVELKIDDFKPEYLGKLNFYLEALDRDVRKPDENPSVGIILCKSKNEEVVEYALSRNLSPALVAEYKTKLIPKQILRKKLHEYFLLAAPEKEQIIREGGHVADKARVEIEKQTGESVITGMRARKLSEKDGRKN
ncbi:MAG: DUF1016 family protein [Chlamydiae bacterium]|nr:DUF1016 family protein [Chlamydiota bacterium]MBI3266952.1 DUF1016 family protein [Chlamydiota bacterium]